MSNKLKDLIDSGIGNIISNIPDYKQDQIENLINTSDNLIQSLNENNLENTLKKLIKINSSYNGNKLRFAINYINKIIKL